MAEKEPMTHVFLKQCGCVSALIVDYPYLLPEEIKEEKLKCLERAN